MLADVAVAGPVWGLAEGHGGSAAEGVGVLLEAAVAGTREAARGVVAAFQQEPLLLHPKDLAEPRVPAGAVRFARDFVPAAGTA
jgi:hypothetical protein